MTFAVVWSYWIGVALVIPAIALVIATIIGYVVKVSKPRYPNR
jgi:amino acid permease